MAINSLEEANIALGQAATLVELHDNIWGRALKARADYELGMVKRPEEFNAGQIANALNGVVTDIQDFERRITLLTNTESFGDFRKKVLQGQNLLDVISQFQERMHTQEFYLDIYQESRQGPQHKLPDGEVYDEQKERTKLNNVKAQYKVAVAKFIEFMQSLDLGEPSELEFPKVELATR